MKSNEKQEWSQYHRVPGSYAIEALHARFVTHRYPRHAHDHFVVGLIDAGAQSYWYRGARHVTTPGKVFLVNPDEPHTGEAAATTGYVYRTLYPRVADLARVAKDMSNRNGAPFFKEAVIDDPLLARLLSNCHRSLALARPQLECETNYLRVLERLITAHCDFGDGHKSAEMERPAVKRAREYMEENFAKDVSLSELSKIVSLSPYHFARRFERAVGLPPHAYLEGIRIRRACELLIHGESLAHTAIAVGYSDQSHLTRRFRRFLGITPGQYLRAQDSTRRPAQRSAQFVGEHSDI